MSRTAVLGIAGGKSLDIVGGAVVSALALVLMTSVWFGLQIRQDSGAMLLQEAHQRRLGAIHAELVGEKEQLASRKRIVKLAGKSLGLFPPRQDQVIHW